MLKTDQWRVDIVKNGGDWTWIIRDNLRRATTPGRHIATVNKYLRDVQEVSNLLAAAPALLAACKELLDNLHCADCVPEHGHMCSVCTQARAAIAQAGNSI